MFELVLPYIDVVDELLLLTESHQRKKENLQKNNKSLPGRIEIK